MVDTKKEIVSLFDLMLTQKEDGRHGNSNSKATYIHVLRALLLRVSISRPLIQVLSNAAGISIQLTYGNPMARLQGRQTSK